MKYCSKCDRTLSVSEFNKRTKSKDGLQPYCRSCSHRLRNEAYRKYKEKEGKYRSGREKEIREWFYSYKKGLSCSQCGEDRHYCLDFHHENDDKKKDVSYLVCNGASIKTIKAEIDKCVVLCKNCHAEIHFKDVWASG